VSSRSSTASRIRIWVIRCLVRASVPGAFQAVGRSRASAISAARSTLGRTPPRHPAGRCDPQHARPAPGLCSSGSRGVLCMSRSRSGINLPRTKPKGCAAEQTARRVRHRSRCKAPRSCGPRNRRPGDRGAQAWTKSDCDDRRTGDVLDPVRRTGGFVVHANAGTSASEVRQCIVSALPVS
jgi:hypothetical protein